MIPLFKVFMSRKASERACEVLQSGYIGQGDDVDAFEEELATYLGCQYLLTVNSGTSALTLAVYLVKEGISEIATTPLTCFATTAAILNNCLKPRWIDVDFTGNICLNKVNDPIMVVHFAGYPVDLDKLKNHTVIEDCAHAFGSFYKGQKIGCSGNICCFSFQAVKTLTTVDGGAIVLPTKELYDRAKKLRWFGMDRKVRGDIQESGWKYHMNNLNAAIGRENLKCVDFLLQRQKANFLYYQQELTEISLPYEMDGNGWLYPIMVKNKANFEKRLWEYGIEAGQPHVRNDLYSCVKGYQRRLPNMDILERHMTCIPCSWWVTDKDREHIVKVIKRSDAALSL